jgi:glucokinase
MSEERIAVGVDLGGTKIHTVVATAAGRVLGEDRRPTLAIEGPEAVVARIAASVRAACEAASIPLDRVDGVGISSPGPCDPKRGLVTNAPNLPGFVDVPITRLVSEALSLPVLLENDANAACYGEFRFGAGRGKRHIVYVTLGTGVGGGIIIDGKIYEGASGAAGEVGHIIVDPDGPLCNCGARGCVEAFASGPAIAREAKRAIAEGRSALLAQLAGEALPTSETVLEAAQQNDPVAREIITRAGYYLGIGLIGILNCLNPEALILGGGLIALGDLYLQPAINTAKSATFEQIMSDVVITIATLGSRSGAVGAAALVMKSPSR